MVVLDATIVNVALPSIQADLDMSESGLQWVVNAYALLFGGFLLLGGRAGDLIGRKRVFLAGPRAVHGRLAALRARDGRDDADPRARAPGLGAALVSPAALSIVTTTFREGAERTKALGVWAAIAGRRRRGRPRARRDPRRGALLAVDLLRQRPGRDRGVPRLAPVRARVEGRARAQELRPGGRRDRDGRPDRARLRHRALGGVRLGLGRRCSASSRSPPSCSSRSC